MFCPTTRILIVDDMRTIRNISKNFLGQLGFTELVEAENGLEGMRVLESEDARGSPVGLVISDCHMPGGQGIDFLKSVRKHPRFGLMPFLMISGESDSEQSIEAANYAPSAQLLRPFNMESFQAAVRSAFERHHRFLKVR